MAQPSQGEISQLDGTPSFCDIGTQAAPVSLVEHSALPHRSRRTRVKPAQFNDYMLDFTMIVTTVILNPMIVYCSMLPMLVS